MKKLLIVTNKRDMHADYVISKLNEIGVGEQIVRLNTEDILTNLVVTFNQEEFHITLRDSGRQFSTKEVGCVWYRRPEPVLIPEIYPNETHEYIREQLKTLLDGLFFCTAQALWINPRDTARISSNKFKQLQVAKQIGFKIPATVVTNQVKQAQKFANSFEKICVKRYSRGNITVAEELYPFFTIRPTSEEMEAYISHIQGCPVLFQEFIDKIFDLRVTTIGDKLYSVEIHSQEHEASQYDFRVVSPKLLIHKLHDLPKTLCAQIKEFMNYYHLTFSAFDFAVTAQGEYYFLENNPNGQWLWLEIDGGASISDGLVKLMMGYIS